MSEKRIDPDYSPTEEQLEVVAKLLARAALLPPPIHERVNGNGLSKWVLGIVAGLIVLGIPSLIAAEFYSSSRIAVLETKVDMLLKLSK